MREHRVPRNQSRGGGQILAVSAHPDDVEFTSGGSMAQWAREGWRTHLVVCTDGGKGSRDARMDPWELASRHRDEQEAAADTIGVSEVAFLDHPDGTLAAQPDLVGGLTRLIRRIRPERVLCWDPWRRYQLHPDHRAAGFATLDAVLAAGNPHYYPEQLAEGMVTHEVSEVYLFGAGEADTWVDISDAFAVKMAAIECHASQVESIRELARDMSQCANMARGAA